MRITKLSLISALALVISSAIASQTIDFSNKNIARYTLLDKTWACNMVDSLGEGQGRLPAESRAEGRQRGGGLDRGRHLAGTDHPGGDAAHHLGTAGVN